jgi:hypothetical protein
MLSRQDLTSPSRQDKNAGNSGDLVKHTLYLAVLSQLSRAGRKVHIVEAHGGKGVYVSSNPHLRKAREAAPYSTSILGQAQAGCFAPPPDGLGVVAELAKQEVAYAGSGALHAKAVANGLADSLELLDADSGVRAVADRIFAEDCFRRCAATSERAIQMDRPNRQCCPDWRQAGSVPIMCCTSIPSRSSWRLRMRRRARSTVI